MVHQPFIDLVIATILVFAVSRGLWIGLIREGLSIAALGAATIVTRIGVDPLALRLTEWSGGELTGRTALWISGILLVLATLLVVGTAARMLRRGAQFVGLGWADRLGGGALGFAEGAVLSAVLLVVVSWWIGPDHPSLADSRSLEILEQLRELRSGESRDLPAVAAPGPRR